MTYPKLCALAIVAGAAAMPAAAQAQAASPLVATSSVQLDKQRIVDGKIVHELIDIDKTREKVPGAHLVYTLTYRNAGAQPITHVVVTDPLPAAEMLSDDGFGDFLVSVDGGKTFAALSQLTVDDGKGGRRAAQAGDVTTLSWTIPVIAPGQSVTLSFHSVIR